MAKKVSAFMVHKEKMTKANKKKSKSKKVSKVEKKKAKKKSGSKDKTLLTGVTHSESVTVITLPDADNSSPQVSSPGFIQETPRGHGSKEKGSETDGKPSKKSCDTAFITAANNASIMFLEGTPSGSEKIAKTDVNKNRKRKEMIGKRKTGKRIRDGSAKNPVEGDHGNSDNAAELKDCVKNRQRGDNQRNRPKFESDFVRKNYQKHLLKETVLNKEEIAERRKQLKELSESDDEIMEEQSYSACNRYYGDEKEKMETSDIESESESSVDDDGDSASDEDILDSLEQQETLFRVFGLDQTELGNCGTFGFGSSDFQFHEPGPADNTDPSVLNDSGYSCAESLTRLRGEDQNPVVGVRATKVRDQGMGGAEQDGRRKSARVKGSEVGDQAVGGAEKDSRRKSTRGKKAQEGAGKKMAQSSGEDITGMQGELKCVSIPVPKQEATLVVLGHPLELCIQGKASITMVTGEIIIMGHRLQPDNSYRVYSPISNSYNVLKTAQGQVDFKHLTEKVSVIFGSNKSVQEVKDELKIFQGIHSIAFVVRPLDSEAHNYISTMSPYNGLFTIRTEEPLPHNLELLPLGLGLFPREYVMRPWLKLSKDIKQILDLWEVMIGRGDKSGDGRAPVILTCGGKNSGKSTLNRHLINSTLNMSKGVSYMELDIGQTEFSPPGCMSLHHVTEPVLGPPFTHVRKAERMCYFGAVSAGANVSMYVKCVKYVFAAHKGDNPLIINTMGWNKGIGLKLLVDILHITNPDIVVQMDTYKPLDNFPPITPHFKMAEQGWLYNRQATGHMQQEVVADEHELCVLQTPVMKMHQKFITWTAADHRNVTLLSYFCDSLKPSQSLLSLTPYTVPWTAVAVYVCDAAGLRPSKMLLVLNGGIVGLCVATLPEVKVTGDLKPRLLKTLPVCQCLGLGLVRGIDPKTKLFYIVTPLTQDELGKVNVLVKGSVTLPDQVTRQQKTDEAKPYCDNLTRSIGSWKTNFKDRKMKRPGAVFRSHQK
ncbi:uncharacterized protein LOC124123529 isoform X1 [Haliotis rufescens]|uniref:uncharacterized protein LOC124123529 isoform X1 n=1 Tax=Haliotis rufescens TaxID=6454 RepID=UPI00201F4EAC|nr:uncharacterized protein LOC124123529 isoform X1 [Haliotis rufescens]XP_048257722.1 uncharacterized protein LOC124123529 isoform X1 [Haliotis rufescens]XP_048257723.1 uncharacterized protein LOC124123529 isoform X1 [Haliotis rufescens]